MRQEVYDAACNALAALDNGDEAGAAASLTNVEVTAAEYRDLAEDFERLSAMTERAYRRGRNT